VLIAGPIGPGSMDTSLPDDTLADLLDRIA